MPIPDEKARAWTRPEDYWPTRRPARVAKTLKNRKHQPGYRGDPLDGGRPSLTTWPYAIMLACLAVLTIAIMIMAFPGRRAPTPPAEPVTVEVGTAPKGWIDER